MTNLFKIHPAIGVARLGDSTTEFCLTPEAPMGLPVNCDNQGRALLNDLGNEQPIATFKDSQGRIKRQAVRFRVYVYQDEQDAFGAELKIGDHVEFRQPQTGEVCLASVIDTEWTVYLANKKASWYQFTGTENGQDYAPNHPLRNPSIVDATARQTLMIDPGPQTVRYLHSDARRAEFTKDRNPSYPQSFPSALSPHNIETLGEIIVHQQDDHNRLVVLGGLGRSGSFRSGFGEPHIETFANNDGWFDDVSDGPVTASLWVQPLGNPDAAPIQIRVDDPAWVLVTYPGYVPEIENMLTLDDIAQDVAVRNMDYAPEIYRSAPASASHGWNKAYTPYFYRDIWPILRRPNVTQWMMAFADGSDLQKNLNLDAISVPPAEDQHAGQREANAAQRQYIYATLRKPGKVGMFHPSIQSDYNYQSPLIPLLSGDNLLQNTDQPGFFHLTETQLFFLQQWVDGKFVNDKLDGVQPQIGDYPLSGTDLDRFALQNVLGNSFCPGSESNWILYNPAIYAKPYRIKHAPYMPGSLSQPACVRGADTTSDLRLGLEPGDLTRYSALPWQADFNECANQNTDVTYETWMSVYSDSAKGDLTQAERGVFWWPAHRPMEVFLPIGTAYLPQQRTASETEPDQFRMIGAWAALGFIHAFEISENTNLADAQNNDDNGSFLSAPEA